MGSFLIVFALIAAIVIDLLTPGRPIPLVYTIAILMTTTRASTRTTVVVSVVVLLANVSINTYQGLSPGLLLLYDGVLAVVCSIATYVSALLENQNREIALKSREAMQQQDLLKAVMDNSEAAIFLKDRDSRILFMNRQTAEAMGTTVEEGTGKTDREIFKDQKVAERMIANDQRIMASGETQLIEELIPVADGVRTFLSSKFPIRDRSGEITGVGGIATDFTERKITQDLIQKSQENLLMAQRVGHVGNFDWNVLTSELYWSEENYRIYGLAPDVVPSIEGYLATIDPEDLTFVQQAMDDAFSRRKPYDIDMRIVRPDGSKGFVHTQAEVTFDAAGQPTRMFGTVQDITERKQAEEAIRESEARLKRAHKVARLGSWEWDVITGDLFWAEGNYSLHGIDPEKEKPSIEAWMAVVDPAEHEYVNQSVADALAGNSLFEIDYTAIRPDNGKRVVINSKADVIRDSAGNAVRMVGTVQDITDRKQMEEVLAFLAKSGGASANDEFFQSLAAFLAEKLEMFYVCIDRLEGDGLMARTVAVYSDGRFEDDVTYALKDTPCGNVVGMDVCCFPASVCQFFPRDQVLQDLRAESYVGVT
ncbi:MAG: PAS domain S-box protein, partial [Dehalococcoidia bacterium]|nr:PAS domain S-box protein [Dehalococcoidia bacterium]